MATPSIPAGFKLVPDDQEQNMAPEARGKAAAMSSYLAKKGSPSGKRLDRHVQRFERMWAKADPRIKNKYAAQSRNDLAPIERPAAPAVTNATLNAARPGETTGQAQERFRLSRTKNDPKPPVAPPAAAPSAFAELTKPVPAPAGGVNSIGDGQFEAGQLKGKTPAEQRAMLTADATANPPTEAKKTTQSTAPPSPNLPATDNSTPIGRAWDQSIRDTKRQIGQVVDFVTAPVRNDVARATDQKAASDAQVANQARVNAETAARQAEIAKIKGSPAPTPAAGTTQPAPAAQPATVQAQVAAASPPATPPSPAAAPMRGSRGRTSEGGTPPPIAAPAAPTGAPVMNRPAPVNGQVMDPAVKSDNGAGLTRVNRLTGLPFGFQPGDAAPKAGGAAMQQRAADSVTRQSQAQAAVPPIAPPRATIAPATDRYADAQSQYQADKGPADAMDKVYAGASGIDQAKITAQSLKRAGALNRTQTQPPARRPMATR